MSARSRLRPSTRKRQASSRLIVSSAMPATRAARSRTQPKNSWVVVVAIRTRSIPIQVVFRHCHRSVETVSRARRAFSLAAPSEPTIALGYDGVVGQTVEDDVPVHVLVLGRLQTHDGEQRPTGLGLGELGVLEKDLQMDVENPRRVVGPLDVATDPEQRLGDPAQHGRPRWGPFCRDSAHDPCCCCCCCWCSP